MKHEPTDGTDNLILWTDMMNQWPTLSKRTRRRAARRAGIALHDLWRRRFDLQSFTFELTAFEWRDGELHWRPEKGARHKRRFSTPHASLPSLMADWHATRATPLSPMEIALILGAFLSAEGLDRPTMKQIAATLATGASVGSQLDPPTEYQRALATKAPPAGGVYRGHWAPDPRIRAALIATETDAAEREFAETPIKRSRRITVFRAGLFGRDSLVKRYESNGLAKRCRDFFRPTPARRAWATGQTLQALGISTPSPYGYLEIKHRISIPRSYLFTAFEKDALNARQWVQRYYRKSDPDAQRRFRRLLQDALLDLYRADIYHADTKLSNVLVHMREDGTVDRLLWIDLECVRFGARPTPYRVIRNLVQINGSVRNAWMTEEERLTFLREMAHDLPFLLHPRSIRKIRRRTVQRWKKELRTRCGP